MLSSDHIIDLILRERFNAVDCLEHKWLLFGPDLNVSAIQQNSLKQRLKKYLAKRRWKVSSMKSHNFS